MKINHAAAADRLLTKHQKCYYIKTDLTNVLGSTRIRVCVREEPKQSASIRTVDIYASLIASQLTNLLTWPCS